MKVKIWAKKVAKVVGVFALAIIAFVCGTVSAGVLGGEEKPTDGNSLIVEQGESHGISMMAADGTNYVGNTLGQSAPYGALQVTATVTPSSASDQKLNWSFVWSSTKSDAVTNYFKLETSGTNAHTAYVWALKPFDVPITVTATSTDGTNKSASMTVHFAKRMTGVTGVSNFVGTFDYSGGVWQEGLTTNTRYSEVYIEEISFTPSYSAGSKSVTWELVDYTISFDDGLTQALTAALGKQCRTEWAYSSGDGYQCHVYNMWTESNMSALFSGANATANYNTLVNCIVNNDRKLGQLYLEFESVETDSLGKKYTYTAAFNAVVNSGSLGLMVENVSLSDQTLTL